MQSIEADLIKILYDNLIKEGMLVILACFVIGEIVKHCLPRIKNDYINLIVVISGIILALGMRTGGGDTFVIGVKGMILGFASTGLYEFGRRIIKLGGKDLLLKIIEVIRKSG